ncbi:MAG TPA: rRNA maturation RNase YbeY [Solirubrobacteraceae bacterium]|nr:rRNA maturation RNase YbeY [Solirubrobacteraceae bacterium]
MLDVEVLGARLPPDAPPPAEVRRLCVAAAARAGVNEGHVAIEFVDADRIAELNARHRGRPHATDVLSFPIDGAVALSPVDGEGSPLPGSSPPPPRELGDVVICPEHCSDLSEAIVHGVLHLLGMDHERDDGEMLALQRELLEGPAA